MNRGKEVIQKEEEDAQKEVNQPTPVLEDVEPSKCPECKSEGVELGKDSGNYRCKRCGRKF